MVEKPDNPKQDPVEGSRDAIDRELKRQGYGKEKGESGQPGSAGRTNPDPQERARR